jgi:LPS-assembly lipoprotein
MSWSDLRRAARGWAALALAAALLSACGFEPVYRPGGDLKDRLTGIYVDPVDSRIGQATRGALLDAIAAPDRNPDARYRLTMNLTEKRESLGIQADETVSRVNINLTADWVLRRVDLEQTVVGSGLTRRSEPFNVVDDDFANVIAQRDAEELVGRLTGEAIRTHVMLLLREQGG